MPQLLQLNRPLAVFDLETTSTNPATARIVEIAVIKLTPDGERVEKCRRLNPEQPIPAESTAIHGITDSDVSEAPTFRQVAKGLAEFLAGCDLCGFNVGGYDLQVLHNEFRRASVVFDLTNRAIVDVKTIYHRLHPRDLSAAVRVFCGRTHSDSHSAKADAAATLDVLVGILARHPELPAEPRRLVEHFRAMGTVDSEGFFTKIGGEVRFARGKFRGQPLEAVAKNDPSYLKWMLTQDFFEDTKKVVASALGWNTHGDSTGAPSGTGGDQTHPVG